MLSLLNNRKTLIGFVIIFSVFVAFVAIGLRAMAAPSADQLRREAEEKRIEARRADCRNLGKKIAAAYDGDRAMQVQVPESSTWFFDEYGQTHDVACLSDDLPFGVGGNK